MESAWISVYNTVTRFLRWKQGTCPVQHTKIVKYYKITKYGNNYNFMYFADLHWMQWTIMSSWSGWQGHINVFWHFCFFKRSKPHLDCSSLPSPCVTLFTLLPFFLLFFTLVPALHFPFSPHVLFPWLVNSINFLYTLSSPALFLLSPSLFFLSISNPSLLKQSHIIKYWNSYHMVTFTLNSVTATLTTIYVTVRWTGLQSASTLTYFFCSHKWC